MLFPGSHTSTLKLGARVGRRDAGAGQERPDSDSDTRCVNKRANNRRSNTADIG